MPKWRPTILSKIEYNVGKIKNAAVFSVKISIYIHSVGAKSQILSSVAPPGRKTWSLFSVRDMSWGLGNPFFTKFSVVNFL